MRSASEISAWPSPRPANRRSTASRTIKISGRSTEAARGHTFSETYLRGTLAMAKGKVAKHGSRSVLIESHIAYTDRALLLIGAGMTLEIVVEGVVTAIEILHLILFFVATNDNRHSVPHSPNQSIRSASRSPLALSLMIRCPTSRSDTTHRNRATASDRKSALLLSCNSALSNRTG